MFFLYPIIFKNFKHFEKEKKKKENSWLHGERKSDLIRLKESKVKNRSKYGTWKMTFNLNDEDEKR